jgi:hypothetical protein
LYVIEDGVHASFFKPDGKTCRFIRHALNLRKQARLLIPVAELLSALASLLDLDARHSNPNLDQRR